MDSYNKKYYQNHKEQEKEDRRKYYQGHKEQEKKRVKKYNQSSKGKVIKKEVDRKYRQSSKGKEIKRKGNAKRRQFGFIPLNKSFEGSEAHHIDFQRVIYIPRRLHRSIWHSITLGIGMGKINKLALEYYDKKVKNKGLNK